MERGGEEGPNVAAGTVMIGQNRGIVKRWAPGRRAQLEGKEEEGGTWDWELERKERDQEAG